MKLPRFLLAIHVLALAMRGLCAEPVASKGEALAKALDALHVEEHWKPGVIVDWRNGEPTGQPITDSPGNHTHCSQFAAAACDRLGVYLLHPPEHASKLLANAQYDWLPSTKGKKNGWSPVPDGITAQQMANEGRLVVAVCKNPDPTKHGHIAIVRPSDRGTAEIVKDGPQVIQAGGTNYNSATLKQGFSHHRDAFEKDEIRFYAHAVKLLPR